MTWAESRENLRTLLSGVDGVTVTFYTPPPQLPQREGILMFAPPARTVRRQQPLRITEYTQRLQILSWSPAGLLPAAINEIADDHDDMIEEINALLDGSIKLGGAARRVSSPEWDETGPVEYPAESGRWYTASMCTMTVEVEELSTIAA